MLSSTLLRCKGGPFLPALPSPPSGTRAQTHIPRVHSVTDGASSSKGKDPTRSTKGGLLGTEGTDQPAHTPSGLPSEKVLIVPEMSAHLDSGMFTPRPLLNHTPPEILAPAGGWPQLRAAVENGADAVYFGVTEFNARARASNFSQHELPDVMAYLHTRGVKGYLAVNVLVFDSELNHVARLAQAAARAHVDAVIVQDVGAVEIIRAAAPGLPIHGSTQMTVTSVHGFAFAAQMGIDRIVLGRELSIKDIASISSSLREQQLRCIESLHEGGRPSASSEIEVFVHGALCVSYSGQCFSSEAWGGRSANRGQCAQACRLEYGMLVDGRLTAMGDVAYLLSPQDLAAVELIPALIDAGVASFKIEGRLKGPEYVAMTTRVYRQAVDAAWALKKEAELNGSQDLSPVPSERQRLDDDTWRELRQVFARGQDLTHGGLTPGFLEGPQHQRLVRGRAPRHRGVCLGTIEKMDAVPTPFGGGLPESLSRTSKPRHTQNDGAAGTMRNRKAAASRSGVSTIELTLTLANPMRRGDGLVIDHGDPESPELGGTVYGITILGDPVVKNDKPRGKMRSPKASSVLEAPAGSRVRVTVEVGVSNTPKERKNNNMLRGRALSTITPGQLVWKTKDPVLESKLRDTYEAVPSTARRRVPVRVILTGSIGSPLRIEITALSSSDDERPERVPLVGVGMTTSMIEMAASRPLTPGEVEATVGRHLGDEGSLVVRCFEHGGIDYESGLFMGLTAVKEARRQAVAQFLRAQQQQSHGEELSLPPVKDALEQVMLRSNAPLANDEYAASPERPSRSSTPVLRVLCRTKAQVDAAVAIPWLKEIILDFLEVHGLKEACQAVRAAGKRVVVAPPRILKPDEHRLWRFYLRLRADALLVRSAGLLYQLIEAGGPGSLVPEALTKSDDSCEADQKPITIPRLEGDFSLNAANVVSVDVFLRAGLDRLAPTHDCNAKQLADMALSAGPARAARLEAILHQNLPIFHTEHCVFARFLSSGNSFLDCGHPCEHHTVHLRDPGGKDHLVLADMGCRNTVFDGTAQSGLPYLDALVDAGFGCLRVELVDQPGEVVGPLLEGYRSVLLHRGSGERQTRGSKNERSSPTAMNEQFWRWMMHDLPDANGRVQGVGLGSLEPKSERRVGDMKPTAASQRAAAAP